VYRFTNFASTSQKSPSKMVVHKIQGLEFEFQELGF